MKNNVVNDTVEKWLCIWCWICKNSCPHWAIIEIKYTENKEYIPVIDEEKCTNCGLCRTVCSKSEINIEKQIKEVAIKRNYYWLDNLISVQKWFTIDEKNYINSASWWVLSTLLCYLLENWIIDSVIHAEALYWDKENKYFKSSISKTTKEINDKRSSFYHPIEFSQIIENIKNDNSIENTVILWTPCVLEAIHNLCKIDKDLKEKIKYKFSLICSHQTNWFFTDSLIKNLSKWKKWKNKLDFRNKENIPNAWNFNNIIISKENIKIAKSRFKTNFTSQWRNYCYSLKWCTICADFFWKYADMWFKDAWGFNTIKKEWETVFTINNEELLEIVKEMKQENIIYSIEVTKEELINSQIKTIDYKTQEIDLRLKSLNKKLFNKYKEILDINSYTLFENTVKNLDFYTKNFNKKLSIFLIKKFNINKLWYLWILNFYEKFQNLFLQYTNLKRKEILKEKKQLKILYTAWFWYTNVWDEAQLWANLDLWKEIYPNNKITILSPNPNDTKKIHWNYKVLKASRKTFWWFRYVDYWWIWGTKIFIIYFLFNFYKIIINAYILKYFWICFLKEKKYKLLLEIKNTDLLHIWWGWFITWKTLSRFYDYLWLIKIARIFNKKVILTWHTIWITQNIFQRYFLKSSLKSVKYIWLRDHKNSYEQLLKLWIKKEYIYPTFDDALFCNWKEYNLEKNNIDKNKKYIIVNTHYWENDKNIINNFLKTLANLLDNIINKYNFNIIFIQMDYKDKDSENKVIYHMKEKAYFYEHDSNYKEIITLIQNAEICITMKHHPIIFAMSWWVPTISTYFDEYYKHKNLWAMKIFWQEKFLLDYNVFSNEKEINKIIENIINDKNKISNKILKKVKKLKEENWLVMKKFLKDNLYI